MLSCTVSHGKHASSWNTTPTPTGTRPSTRAPSNATVPDVGRASPAITSSSVDFPQPEGPTTAKNSPRASVRSSGPSASTSGGPASRPSYIRVMAERTTCASPSCPAALICCTPTLAAVTRAAGEGPRGAGIDGKCESSLEADCRCSDFVCEPKEAEAAAPAHFVGLLLRSSGRNDSSIIFDQSTSPLTAPTNFCARIMLFIVSSFKSPGPQYGTPPFFSDSTSPRTTR